MSDHGLRAVSVNLGGAFRKHHDGAIGPDAWADRHANEYDLVFAQEVPDEDWLRKWTDFAVVRHTAGETYRTKSVLLVRSGVVPHETQPALKTAAYHGSYVATLVTDLPGIGPTRLMSVHASPKRVSADWQQQWIACGVDLPTGRTCGRWDADLLLETVRIAASDVGGVIAAGDWNEAREWDSTHPNDGGVEFFNNVKPEELVDVCCPGDKDGAPTRGDLRIDHVFASPSVSEVIEVTGLCADRPADHHPVEFTIGV
jgi:endonuclease/exonuclease/phosphatase family metal-dependent hydrolase